MKPKYHTLKNFGYAFEGIVGTYKAGWNIRIQSCVGVLALVLGFVFQISVQEWLAVIICIGLVLGGECINTAVEATVDLASPDIHPLAKLAKDACAGGVLLFAIASFFVGCIVFVPKILTALGFM